MNSLLVIQCLFLRLSSATRLAGYVVGFSWASSAPVRIARRRTSGFSPAYFAAWLTLSQPRSTSAKPHLPVSRPPPGDRPGHERPGLGEPRCWWLGVLVVCRHGSAVAGAMGRRSYAGSRFRPSRTAPWEGHDGCCCARVVATEPAPPVPFFGGAGQALIRFMVGTCVRRGTVVRCLMLRVIAYAQRRGSAGRWWC